MKTPDADGWRRTSPVAVLFFIGRLVRDLVKNAWQAVAPLIALAVAGGGVALKIGAVMFAAIVLIVSALRYWYFRYRLDADSVLIREGVLKKTRRDIKFERIQGINTEQNVLYRSLGLVTITFDTAGSSTDEGNLPAVPQVLAAELRRRIGRSPAIAVDDDGNEVGSTSDSLLQLRWPDMIRIGLSDRRALVVLAILGPVLERVEESVDQYVSPVVVEWIQGLMATGPGMRVLIVVSVVVSILVTLALLSVAAAFWRYHDFELSLDGSTLRSTGGLLTRHEVSTDLAKIQTLELHHGIVLRLFRRYRLTVRHARAGRETDTAGDKEFTVPVLTAGQAGEIRERLLGAEGDGLQQLPQSRAFAAISPHFMRIPMLACTLPAVVGAPALLLATGEPASLWLLAWIPLSLLAVYRTWRHAGYLLTTEGLVRRSGLIGYKTVTLLFRKVQRVTVSQSPRQRRKGLATMRLYMASGSVRVPYIDHALAKQLRDYVLYRVETSRQAWH